MTRMRYVVTGGTGFIGRRLVSAILSRADDPEVWVLVRRESLSRFERLAERVGRTGEATGRRSHRSPASDSPRRRIAELGAVDHVVHCGAIYDVTADEDAQRAANVDGTRAVIDLATGLGATLHHVSSIAVAGTFPGEYTEDGLRRRAGPSDAVSPDQVRGRDAGAVPRRACGTASTGPPSSSATPAPARWTRSTARTTSSASWRSWPHLPKFTPMRAARHRPHQHRAGGLCRRSGGRDHARPRP